MPVFTSICSFVSRAIARLWVAAMFLDMAAAIAQPYGLAQRPLVGAFMNGALPAAESTPLGGLQAVIAYPNLTFERPISIVAEPGSNRLMVGEQEGKIYAFENNASVSNKTLFLDLSAVTQDGGAGLMGFAFHPEYGNIASTNRGHFYVFYTYSPQPASSVSDTTPAFQRISRFTVPNGSNTASIASEQVLINQYDRHQWHAGGGICFGANGFLYLSFGDEGGNDDAYNQSQKINSGFFSGVLRIDVDKDPTKSHPIRRQPLSGATPPNGWPPTYSSNYFVPNDNPWLNTNGSILEEFYAIGFRSPHRMTYDPDSGRIWVGDVGNNTWEEVDIVEKGGNYQWSYREGAHTASKPKPSPLTGTEKSPTHEYDHGGGNNCVIGGYVYRGNAFPTLQGKYIFGDNGSGRVWAMTYDGINPTTVTQLCVLPAPANSSGLASFGLDQNNELLISIVGDGAKIYRLAAQGVQAPPPPALLSQTGVFTNLANLTPNPGLIPFKVTAPLWSDNAEKFRWMAVPSNSVVTYSSNGNWSFPVGTVLVKQFELPVNDTNPAVRKRLETRLLVFATNATWYGLTYKWRADNSDADLLPGFLNETNLIITATGMRTQVWYYPSREDCRTCHTANSGTVLGPRTAQFNSDEFYPQTGITDNQLRALSHVGLFNVTINEASIPNLPKTTHILDTNATPELRVRSYLQANCAHCHQPGGVQAFFDARFSTPLTNQNIINATPTTSLGILGARIVAPQSPVKSILHVRDGLVGTNQMPPLAKNMVDTNYINVLTEWINSLPIPPLPAPNVLGRIGNTNTSASSDGIWDNGAYINAARFTAASNMIVTFIYANVVGVTGRYQTAIYTGTTSQPTALLASSLAITNPATGWRQFPLPSPVNLASNTPYWLAIWSDSSSARVYYSSTGGTLRWRQYTNFGDWPNPITTTGSNSYNYNIYANGGSAPAFVAPPTNRTIPEFAALVVTNAATDADTPFQTVGYNLANPPAGATISSNGVITWMPNEAQGPSTNAIITVANDGVVAISNSFQVIVTELNTAPVAISQSLTNAEDAVRPILLTASDPDGPVLNFLVVTNPAHGSLSGTAPNLSYLPGTNYVGPDSFAFRVNDGSLTSAPALVTLTITNVNDAPAAANQSLTVTEDSPAPFMLAITDPDGPATNLLVLTNTTFGALIGTAPNLTYVPNSNFFGSDVFAYRVHDGSLTSALATVAFNVTNVNDQPTAISQSLTNTEDTVRPILLTASDPDGPILNFLVVTNPAHGSLSGIPPNLSYLPNTNYFGADTFAFRGYDGSLTSAPVLVALTITNVNDAPAATNQSLTVTEDAPAPVMLAITDPDGPVTNLLVLTNTTFGALVGTAPNLTYVPNSNFFGSDTYAYRVHDGSLTSALATITFTVTNVNDQPTANSQILTIAEDTVQPILLTASDADGPILNFLVVTNPAHGSLSGTPPSVSYLPDTNYFGADTLAFQVNDGSLTSAPALIMLTITNINDPPSAQPDQVARWMSQGLSTLTSTLLTNDSDVDGDTLSLDAVISPSTAGASVLLTNGEVRYWPLFGQTNSDAFNYLITDGNGSSGTGLVTVTVLPDPPTTELLGIVSGTGSYSLSFTGVPGFIYTVQYTDNLEPAAWQNLGTVTADGSGNVQIEDDTTGNGPSRFYRAVRGIAP